MAKEDQNLAGITRLLTVSTCSLTEPVHDRKEVLTLLIRLLWAAALSLPALGAQAAVVFTTLYSFNGTNDGANPKAGLVQGNDGSFYGTTASGGTNSYFDEFGAFVSFGTVFKISASGALITLYSFTNGADGANPQAALMQGSDGNFYGTTSQGGTNGGNGTVFKISAGGTLIPLHSFTGGNDGEYPNGGLVQGSDGNLYGTTEGGGTNGYGIVFKINTNGALTTLYSFGSITNGIGDPLDGGTPTAALVQGTDGYLYGTTYQGGTNDDVGYGLVDGTLFKISTNGELTTLYSFNGAGTDGENPTAGLVLGSDGNFYGTTSGGTFGGRGTIFKISAGGTLIPLHSFTGGNDGEYPNGGLVQGSDGNFYGTTEYNGFNPRVDGVYFGTGTVFQINTNGALTTLHDFGAVTNASGISLDGQNPSAGLMQGRDGSFYGTTYSGGQGGVGTVFRLTIVPEPPLQIIPFGAEVIITWPTNYAGFNFSGYTLQSTTNLASSEGWTTVYPNPVVIGGQNVVVSPLTGTQQFFKLSQ